MHSILPVPRAREHGAAGLPLGKAAKLPVGTTALSFGELQPMFSLDLA